MAKNIGRIEVEVDVVNKVKGLRTCSVCGRDFPLLEEENYIVRENGERGLKAAMSSEEKLYHAFDCPHCGCQNIVAIYLRPVVLDMGDVCGDCDHHHCDSCEVDDGE